MGSLVQLRVFHFEMVHQVSCSTTISKILVTAYKELFLTCLPPFSSCSATTIYRPIKELPHGTLSLSYHRRHHFFSKLHGTCHCDVSHAQSKIRLRASKVSGSASTDRYPDNQDIRFSTTIFCLSLFYNRITESVERYMCMHAWCIVGCPTDLTTTCRVVSSTKDMYVY